MIQERKWSRKWSRPEQIIDNIGEVWASPVTQQVKNPLAMQETQETQVLSLGQEDPLEEEIASHSSILAGKSHVQRSLAGYSLWGPKELEMT